MKSTAIILLVTLVVLMGLTLVRSTETFMEALRSSGRQLLGFLPVITVAVLVAGFAEALIPKDVVENWLSDSAGWRGIGLAWIAGILTPGGSIIGLPLIAALYKAGVGISILVTYATSFALLSIMRIPVEAGFIGWRLAGVRILASLFLPLVAGALTQFLLPVIER